MNKKLIHYKGIYTINSKNTNIIIVGPWAIYEQYVYFINI